MSKEFKIIGFLIVITLNLGLVIMGSIYTGNEVLLALSIMASAAVIGRSAREIYKLQKLDRNNS